MMWSLGSGGFLSQMPRHFTRLTQPSGVRFQQVATRHDAHHLMRRLPANHDKTANPRFNHVISGFTQGVIFAHH
jgi:hypothetical protein